MIIRTLCGLFFLLFGSMVHATHYPDPSNEVYAEGFNGTNSGWGSWSSASVIWGNSTTRSFKGSMSARVTYGAQWGGFSAGAGDDDPNLDWNQSFPTVGYKHLTFAVYNETLGSDLWLYAQNPTGTITNPKLRLADYAETKSIPQGVWTWIRIPVADLRLGTDPRIMQVAIQSGFANSVVHFDDIGFKANVIFYEGVRLAKGPSILLYYWNLLSAPAQLDFGGGDYYLEVRPAATWGGIQFQQQSTARNVNGLGIPSSDYGGLSLLFKKTALAQQIHVTLVNEAGAVVGSVNVDDSYLPTTLRPMVSDKWYRVLIPISDFFSGTANLVAVVVESNTANTFYVDDVVLVQKLGWPMRDYPHSPDIINHDGGDFGDYWLNSCGGLTKLHSGTDYGDGVTQGRSVYAAARGIVKTVNEQTDPYGGSWGHAIVIQHESDFTSSYLHQTPIVVQNQEVQKGDILGYTKNIVGGSHLHFGLRITKYDFSVSQAGALPQTPCVINGTLYPAFPSYFLDSEKMDWGILP